MRKVLLVILCISIILLAGCSRADPGYNVAVNDDGESVKVDDSTNAQVVILYPHHEVHNGCVYAVSQGGILGNGASRDTLIITSDSAIQNHLVIKIETAAEASYTLYEGTTTSNDGTPETIVNKNRISTNASATVITYDPTVTVDGTVLLTEQWGTGRARGGEERSEAEWVLDYNTKYLLRVTNTTVSDNYASTVLIWYEHTPD